jgi:hypothetical protein
MLLTIGKQLSCKIAAWSGRLSLGFFPQDAAASLYEEPLLDREVVPTLRRIPAHRL